MRPPALFLVAAAYLVAGLAFGALARAAPSSEARVAWRLAAWAISAGVFIAHVRYERVRRRSAVGPSARRAALAVALGAFGLAVMASLHGRAVHRSFPASSLVVWPLLTGVAAFVVALGAATLLPTSYPETTAGGTPG